MQKKLIALAVAGLASTGAFAQVSLYGVADVYVGSFKTEGATTTASRTAVNNGLLSGSRIGFTAEEDLGDGMKAVARIESAIAIDTSGVFGVTRQAYAGLDTAAGRFSLGRQYAPGYFAALASDGVAGAAMGTQSILTLNSGATISPNSTARIDNSINWVSKPLGPVTLNVLYGLGEDNKDSGDVGQPNKGDANNFLGIGAQAKIAALTVDVVYHSKNAVQATNSGTNDSEQKEMFVGAAYNLGVATLGASYQTNEKDGIQASSTTVTTATGTKTKDKIYTVSAVVPVGKGNVHLAYSGMKSDNTTKNVAGSRDGQKSMVLAYTHALGKRTTLYAGYNQTKIEANNADTINTIGLKAGNKASLLAAGMRLTF